MKMKNKKIKVAMVTNHFGITGIGTVMMNYGKALDKNKYDLTILVGKPISEKYEKECLENGIHLEALPSRHGNPKKHYVALWKALRAGNYDIVHDHGSSSMMAVELTIAKLAGVKNRIAHSHNSTCPNMRVHRLLNPYFRTVYTKALACGRLAGNWLFGENNFEVLPNGFHTDDFAFSKKNRDAVRNKLGVENQLLIGHIGRINEQKNQEYLLDVFKEVAAIRGDAILLIVGIGPDEEKIKSRVKEHPYRDRIILYGETDNPTALYSAMDIFVFPSRYEGLPVVLLEAQISGLPCVVSDKVTREVDLGDINWQSIDDDPKQWAKAVVEIRRQSNQERLFYKEKHLSQIRKYNIACSVKQLDKIYTNMITKDNCDLL
ncbi:glycosyltransferase family 1 protein [Roseburia sp. TF10-5]|nr:glycosyltransferase family 1 protein [Roseburia sp. TF10-5]